MFPLVQLQLLYNLIELHHRSRIHDLKIKFCSPYTQKNLKKIISTTSKLGETEHEENTDWPVHAITWWEELAESERTSRTDDVGIRIATKNIRWEQLSGGGGLFISMRELTESQRTGNQPPREEYTWRRHEMLSRRVRHLGKTPRLRPDRIQSNIYIFLKRNNKDWTIIEVREQHCCVWSRFIQVPINDLSRYLRQVAMTPRQPEVFISASVGASCKFTGHM